MQVSPKNGCAVFSPGRINLIGEHIDYCDGIVLPAAINKGLHFIAKMKADRTVVAHSTYTDQAFTFSLDDDPFLVQGWTKYLSGALKILQKNGHRITGLEVKVKSTLPVGSGLSSSSALIIGVIEICTSLFELNISPEDKIDYARQVEQTYIGVQGGIMDQYAIVYGQNEDLVCIDCLTKTHEYVPFRVSGDLLYLINSDVPHDLASSEYNLRRQDCRDILSILKVNSFRDLKPENLQEYIIQLRDEKLERRLTHILTEFMRVDRVKQALELDDFSSVKQAINECQRSLQNNYNVSCEQIDWLINRLHPVGISARMMGGGFGGSILVWLSEPNQVNYLNKLLSEYNAIFGLKGEVLEFKIGDGVRVLERFDT